MLTPRFAALWLTLAGLPMLPLGAQTPPAVTRAAETTITHAALAGPLAALAADSLQPRPTPSAALDRTAQYLAAEFQRLGLQAGFHPAERGGDGRGASAWVLRYPIPGQQRLDRAASHLSFIDGVMAGGQFVLSEQGDPLMRWTHATFDRTAHFAPEIDPPVIAQTFNNLGTGEVSASGSEQVTLVAGPQTAASLAASLASIDPGGQVFFYIPSAGVDSAAARRVIARLYAAGRGVAVVREPDTTAFLAAVAEERRRPLPLVDAYLSGTHTRWPWAIDVRSDVVGGVLAAAGVDVPTVRASTTPVIRDLGHIMAWLQAVADTTGQAVPITSPIVLGLIPGMDSLLAHEYVVLATSMDTPPPRAGTLAPSRMRDVNVAGLLALARAFRDPAVRLRRSVLLLATTGETGGQDAWGSRFLMQRILAQKAGFDFNAFRSVLVTFDVTGTEESDSLVLDGGALLDVTPSPAWVAMEHATLRLTLVDQGTSVAPGSTAGAFVQNQLPALALHGPPVPGGATDTRGVALTADGGAVQALRYLFFLGYALANAAQTPQWTAAARHMLLEPSGR